jgi:hypothetical protein
MRVTFLATLCSLVLLGAVLIYGASPEQTWTGEISDSHCAAEHVPISEGDPVLPSPECVKVCLRAAFKYVLVVDEKVYGIANQDYSDLAKFAGQAVKVTGELKDGAISVSKVESTQ